jgi:hypothetical protein
VDRIKIVRKPSPHLLPTESPVELEEDRRGIREALKPTNRIAEIYAEQFAHDNWLAKRYRRAQTQIVKGHLPDALYHVLCGLGVRERRDVIDLVERWSRGEPAAKGEVRAILHDHGLEEQDIEGEALRRSMSELGPTDELLTSAAARRDKALPMYAFANQLVAGQREEANAKAPVAKPRVVGLESPKRKAG